MSEPGAQMIYTRFYDQVLNEIEAGKVHNGINLLVGMLDTVDLQAGSLAQARRELRGHSLCQMLREDPVVAQADTKPDCHADRLSIIGQTSASAETSSTGRRLFEVTRELTFARALRERRDSFGLKLSRGWQQGQNICLIAYDSTEYLSALNGSDVSNIAVVGVEDVSRDFVFNADSHPQYDFILAPDLLDRCDPAALLKCLTLLRTSLSDQGSIVLAGLTPQHLGAGWRSVCLNWHPYCYDERGLAQVTKKAGFSARMYRDETNSIVWAELRNVAERSAAGKACNER